MGLLDKIINNNNPVPQHLNQLNVQELEFLILLIKENTFKGEDLETVYNTTLKLQNQFLEQNK
jgi:hypothetical protein